MHSFMAGRLHSPNVLVLPMSYKRKGHIYKAGRAPACMVLRYVKPLPPEAWEDFMAALKRGPTPEQVRIKERAIELTRHMFPPEDEDLREQGRD